MCKNLTNYFLFFSVFLIKVLEKIFGPRTALYGFDRAGKAASDAPKKPSKSMHIVSKFNHKDEEKPYFCSIFL